MGIYDPNLEAFKQILAFSTGKSNGHEQERLEDIQQIARASITRLQLLRAESTKKDMPAPLTPYHGGSNG